MDLLHICSVHCETTDTSRHVYFDDDYMLSGEEQALKDQTKSTYAQYIELLRQRRLDRLDMMYEYEYSLLQCSIRLGSKLFVRVVSTPSRITWRTSAWRLLQASCRRT